MPEFASTTIGDLELIAINEVFQSNDGTPRFYWVFEVGNVPRVNVPRTRLLVSSADYPLANAITAADEYRQQHGIACDPLAGYLASQSAGLEAPEPDE